MPDVVVVGAGHNGLTAACYLAEAGRSVVVVEAAERVGGMTMSAPLVSGAPEHLLSPCAIDAVYWRASTVERDLRLPEFGLRTVEHDPAWAWLGASGESLLLCRDVKRTIAEIERFSVGDARVYREFAEVTAKALAIQDSYGAGSATRPSARTLVTAARNLADGRVRKLLGAALTRPAAELIESTFASTQVRGAFACMASILGSITVDSSGVGILATAPLHRYGVVRPVGGMQAIPDALLRCLRHHGGEIRLGTAVSRVLLERGAVRGVLLADGTTITAGTVIAAVPPQVTGALLTAGNVDGLGVLESVPSNSAGIGCFTLGMALRGRIELTEHYRTRTDADLRKPTMFHGTLDQVVAAEHQARTGRIPDDPPWTATILSATDPSQAPAGQDNLYLYGPAPVRPNAGWAAERETAAQALLKASSGVLGELTQLEIGRFAETPEDLEHRLGAVNGCIYHADQIVTRLGPLRPGLGWAGHRTKVPGLILSGAGTHPGGGVSGIPGQLAAKAVLRASARGKGNSWVRK